MVEPTDATMPILLRIQGDVAGINRRLDEIVTVLAHHTGRLNELNGYMTFSLSPVTRHTGENEAFRAELDAIKRRLARLEAQT